MLTFDDFKNFKTADGYELILKKKCFHDNKETTKSKKKTPVKWARIVELQFRKEFPFILYYKYEYDEEYHETTIGKSLVRSRPGIMDLEQCYENPIGITAIKKKDLISLCNNKKIVIPKHHHRFYKDLLVSNERDDSDSDDSDCEDDED